MSKILVVEDDSLLVKLYSAALTDAGFEPIIAHNGEEGLAKIKEGGYDLILLDVMMPIMDGLTVLDRLKSLEPKNTTPIVMMTNLSGGIEEKALAAGAVAYIDKSKTKATELAEKVKGFIQVK